MTTSDAASISLRELLEIATPEDQEQFMAMSLGCTETCGASDLCDTIATLYTHRHPSEILRFAGASEGFFAA